MAISKKKSSLAQLFHENPLFEWHLDFGKISPKTKKKAALHLGTTTDP
jgi:hypothetical protein